MYDTLKLLNNDEIVITARIMGKNVITACYNELCYAVLSKESLNVME